MRTTPLIDAKAAALLAAGLVLAASLALPGWAARQTTGGQNPVNPVTLPQYPNLPAIANSDSNGTMIAVTGIDLTGASILYLVDTEKKQLAIYQATGGTESMQGVKLVGARRIDLDLQLEGLNDRSEYSYEELARRFAEIRPGAPTTDRK